jgi:hypothetical protein
MRVEKSRTTGPSPKSFVTWSAWVTTVPLPSASVAAMRTLPAAFSVSRRRCRSAASSPTRRMLRLRRAVTP